MVRLFNIGVIVFLAAVLAGCGAGGSQSGGSTPVTITLGGGGYSAEYIPYDIGSVRFTITAPDMDAMTRSITVSHSDTDLVSESFDVPNGAARHFLVEAIDPEGAAIYAGSATVDLSGAPIILEIMLRYLGGDRTPPTAPTGLSAEAVSQNRIDLTWTASTDDVGVAGYNVYDVSDGLLLNTSSTSAQVSNLSPDTGYCFRVTAVDTAGNESGPSNTACATTQPSVEAWSEYRYGWGGELSDLCLVFRYLEPVSAASGVTVTGPGLDQPLSLADDDNTDPTTWAGESCMSPDLAPRVPADYPFEIIEPLRTITGTDSIGCLFFETAADLYPTSYIFDRPSVFIWSTTETQGVEYQVELKDAYGTVIWLSPLVLDASSVAYDGPTLDYDTYYDYRVIATPVGSDCSSSTYEWFYLYGIIG